MPAANISMRKIREILRLRYQLSLSFQQIADSLNISIATVSNYIKRAQEANVGWPLPAEIDETELERLLTNQSSGHQSRLRTPDFPYIHNERKGVTLQLLWEEYVRAQPDTAYKQTEFYELYRRWRGHLRVSLRQTHGAGERMFVDYAGQTVPVRETKTGEVHQAQIFVAVLGASNYTFVEASWTQNLFDWISSHVRAFTFFQGTTEIIVPDNLRSGVSKASLYEPELNLTYAEMARLGYRASRGLVSLSRHYGAQRLEKACQRAIAIGSLNYQSIANILKVGLDHLSLESEPAITDISQLHENVREADYYRSSDDEFIN